MPGTGCRPSRDASRAPGTRLDRGRCALEPQMGAESVNGSSEAMATTRNQGPSLAVACAGFAGTTTLFTVMLLAISSLT